MIIPVVIPSFEPDTRFVTLVQNLINEQISPIIVVDDGSSEQYQKFFYQIQKIMKNSGIVLKHKTNQGKGKALKTAFEYILKTYPNALGCITADCDGQHSSQCIKKLRETFSVHPNSLILGSRQFNRQDIPLKSKFGNLLTRFICRFFANLNIQDTQTGLRCIPLSLMPDLINLKGNRFEYEMQMLVYCTGKLPILEVPIKTIYDSSKNHQTHFNPLKDSVKIYFVILKQFYKYIISSFLSFALDITMFWYLCRIFKSISLTSCIIFATILSRICSALFNIALNYLFVFNSKKNLTFLTVKYSSLAVCIMLLSATLVSAFAVFLPILSPVYIKIIIDSLLFVLSFYIQKKYVF